LAHKLHGLGFSTVSFLSGSEADTRYFRGRHDGLHAPRKVGIVTATVQGEGAHQCSHAQSDVVDGYCCARTS
jgi:hypothetical protein